ncbi:MAG: response regulator transcription factor [Eubacterium sp.]|nr:response regulator transcription factor [Eubacterium sp.]
MKQILLVEDNPAIVMGLEYLLKEEGYGVTIAEEKEQAERLLRSEKFDLILLDVSLPDGDGFELCQKIKEKDLAPVIFLTARDEEKDVVLGFDLGADDYVTKPFRNRELISRIKNIFRRYNDQKELVYGNLRLNEEEGTCHVGTTECPLTRLEFEILRMMLNNPKKLFTREELLSIVWDSAGNFVNDNTLTVTIKRLREKIGDKDSTLIKTVRGMGYRLGSGE